jgi:hypothetical protein
MKRRVHWSIGLAIVGAFVAQKQTYWLPGTYLRDIEACSFAIVGCGVAGFTLACIVETIATERQRRMKLFYWLIAMTVFGLFLGFGKGVAFSTTVTVLASTLAVGLVVGGLQYFFQRPKLPT